MKISPLAMSDAWVLTPNVFADDRGEFFEWFRPDLLLKETGFNFEVAQANESISRLGTIRGLHFAETPPGQAKWVHCAVGSILDVVVDIRTKSPTFGTVATIELSAENHMSVVLAEGLGHGFCALSEGSVVSYLLTDVHRPGGEHGISPLDPALAIPWPISPEQMVLSDKDRAAPSLAEAREAGLLPS